MRIAPLLALLLIPHAAYGALKLQDGHAMLRTFSALPAASLPEDLSQAVAALSSRAALWNETAYCNLGEKGIDDLQELRGALDSDFKEKGLQEHRHQLAEATPQQLQIWTNSHHLAAGELERLQNFERIERTLELLDPLSQADARDGIKLLEELRRQRRQRAEQAAEILELFDRQGATLELKERARALIAESKVYLDKETAGKLFKILDTDTVSPAIGALLVGIQPQTVFSDHVSGVLAGLEPAAAALKSNAPEQATRLYWEHHLLVRGHVAAGLAGSLEPLASRVEHPAARENLLSVARTLRTASVTPKQAVEAAFAAPWIEPLENPPSLVARQDSLLEEAASGLRRLRRCAGEAKGRDFDRGLLRGLAAVAPALEAFTNSNNSTGNGGFTDLEFWTLHARLYYSIAEALAASTEALLPRLTDPAIAASLSAWAAALRTPLPDTQGMDISYPPSFWFGAALSQKQQLSQAAAALHALLSRYGLE